MPFSHNGELRDHRAYRPAYATPGRLHGRADTEVGARWREDAWAASANGGLANLALLLPDGSAWHYAGNDENRVFGFRLGPIRFLCTAAYSIDRSLFRLVAPGAREWRVVQPGEAARL